jgi:hypothetical protein
MAITKTKTTTTTTTAVKHRHFYKSIVFCVFILREPTSLLFDHEESISLVG